MRRCLLALTLVVLAIHSRADTIDFDSQVRPILSDNCFHCHGPDEATREADLRLDTADGAKSDLGGYAAFVAGKPDESEAIIRILSDDPDSIMPPPESKLRLTDAEKAVIRDWVSQGADWSEHWSFVRPVRPSAAPDDSGWSRNAIDRFVRAQAIANGLQPSQSASRETLIRRVTLDLTGLPPTPQEVGAFLADQEDDAYEKVVDRLLASPRYGERMAWEWLDAARYADTDGFQGDPTRTMWPWRDWLVNALNDNMPFDQFTIEMLAGDLLPDATPEQILATGFNRNHMFNGEGGRIAEETRVENVFDRAETTGTVWMGLTMTCCRCHDHKYDALSQEDYFRLYAFFDKTSETGRSGRGKTPPVLDYQSPDARQQLANLDEQISKLQSRLRSPMPELDAKQAAWESDLANKLAVAGQSSHFGPWWQLGPIEKPGKQAFESDLGPESQVDLNAEYGKLSWEIQTSLKDGSVYPLPETVGATYFYRTVQSPSDREVTFSLGSDDAIKVFVNGTQVLQNFAARPAAADQEIVTVDLKKGANELLIKIVNTGGIGGFYFKKTSESAFELPAAVVTALRKEAGERDSKSMDLLRDHFRSIQWPEWSGQAKKLDSLKKRRDALAKNATTVMVMDELPAEKRRETFILTRGGYDKPTDVSVTPATPDVLPPMPKDAPPNRLSLARWLVSPNNPLTARVTVNRYWQTFFGRGIVKSTEDFGIQGTRPTHPDLLDWLAVEFMESGWNVKELHKLIVMSSTYRQSAQVTQEAQERDPENTWLARSPRYRMPSWMLRDQALAASGLLNRTMGGPSIKPYQPEGIWADATFGKIKYKRDTGDKLYRRSLYVFWRRIVGPTMFFDGAKRQTCEVKPALTNTPLHALTTLNETTFIESARAMAQRVLKAEKQDDQRIALAFQLVTARRPDAAERKLLSNRLDQLRSDFATDTDAASELLNVGDSAHDKTLALTDHAAYTVICSLLLNLDETLTRQ